MKLLHISPEELHNRLQAYLAADPKFESVYEFTKTRFEATSELTAHNWAHAYRDVLNAIVIGEAEGADMSIVLPAITMHDIGYLYGAVGRTHGAIGADNVANFLADGGIEYPDEVISEIAACIRTHKDSMHDEVPESLEAKVVADADLMEKFGPIGVFQTIRTFTEFKYPLETLLERRESLLNLTLETETGRRLVEPGRKFAADFYEALRDSCEPYGIN